MAKEFAKPYFKTIVSNLEKEDAAKRLVFPPRSEVFAAFNSTPIDKVKVVILGQDPYHNDNQAHGLCFSVRRGIRTPPSLVNIYKELADDLGSDTESGGFRIPQHGHLQAWADRGIFLLNAGLTVRAHEANSHKDYGWQN